MEYGEGAPTSRSVQRIGAQSIIDAGNTNLRNPAQIWGSPEVDGDLKLFGNFGHLFESGNQFYAHTNFAKRTVTGGFYFRNPHTRGGVFRGNRLHPISRLNVYDKDGKFTNFPDPKELDTDESDHRDTIVYDANGQVASLPGQAGIPSLLVGDRVWAETDVQEAGGCATIPVINHVPDAAALQQVEADPNCFTLYSRFPGGFTPQFGGDLIDYSLVSGLRGFMSNSRLTWDASIGIGRSKVEQFIFDTVNASVGYDTPTSFTPGIYQQDELNLNFDVQYVVNDIVHVAGGTEWRQEKFTIGAGGDPSWEIGPYAAQGFSSGSNGFNGYRADTTAGSWSRSNVAAYGDLEFSAPDGQWTLGTALRLERFSDFGLTTNGKVSARVELTDTLALRGAVSSGFRAPTPGQQNTFNVTTAFVGGQLTNTGVVPSTSAVAVARGGEALQPEKSINYSGGAVIERGPFTFTRRLLPNRHRRSCRPGAGNQTDGARDSDAARGRNPRGTEFSGVPVLPERLLDHYPGHRPDFDPCGRAHNLQRGLQLHGHALKNVESSVIDEFRINTLERGLPTTRWNFTVNHDADRWSLMGRVNYYGSYWDSEDGRNAKDEGFATESWLYPAYGGKALLDLELSIPIGEHATLAFGGENVLNTYPEVNQFGAYTVGNQYGQFSPFGFNGAYYYARLGYSF